ncbi:efflux transporter outer membrane subunit [Aquirhabdus sp.]|uniref:efflux transporter outer membrane subunit n=1 Tax=Aquirhabdus sp. TaxID=2824160 RepID=UPI00396C4F9F
MSTHHVMKPLSVFILTALLSACMVGPDFVRPTAPTTPNFTAGGDQITTGDQRLVSGQAVSSVWWQSFASAQLNDVMQQALAGNLTLQATQATLAQAQAQVQASAGALDPQVSLGGTAGRQKYGATLFGPSDFHIPPFTYYSVGPQVSYLLDFAGGKRRSLEQQKALAAYQAYQTQAARLSLTGNVAAQVIGLVSAQTQIAVIQQILIDDQKNIALIQKAKIIGSATQNDLLSLQSQLAADQALLPPLQQQQSTATHALAILVGKAPADWQAPHFDVNEFHLPAALPLSLPSSLVHYRPDIMAAESQLHAASATIGMATANLYPSLTLTANMTQQALTPVDLFKSTANAWAIAGGLSAPLFNGGTLRAEKKAAEAAYQSELANYQQVILQSFGQVADVLKALEHDAEQIKTQQQALDAAQSSLKLTDLSYQLGNSGVLPLLDAERLAHQARLSLVRAKVQQYQDTALLYLALGGGTLSENPQQPIS